MRVPWGLFWIYEGKIAYTAARRTQVNICVAFICQSKGGVHVFMSVASLLHADVWRIYKAR
jgi:hypothetical protein